MTLQDWLSLLDQGIWDKEFLTVWACWFKDEADDTVFADCLIWLRDSGRQPGISTVLGNRFWTETHLVFPEITNRYSLPKLLFDLLSKDGSDGDPGTWGLWYSPPHKATLAVIHAWKQLSAKDLATVLEFNTNKTKTE